MQNRAKGLDALAIASIAFLGANVLHTLDHLRQGTRDLAAEVLLGGTALSIAAVATLVLALTRNRHAALVAAVVGLSSAAGVAAAHIAPHWSAFSNPYPEISADALSWTVMLMEIGGALILGLIAVRELRRRAGTAVPARA